MGRSMFKPDASYTFATYFELNLEVDVVLATFGYTYENRRYTLPKAPINQERVQALINRLDEGLPYISLTNETARREFLIAPILMEVVYYTHARIRVEFPLQVSDSLKGNLDYLLQAHNNLVIVEAKNADLQRGFTQMAVELVALDQWTESPVSHLYGAVSVGDIWRFGILDRHAKLVLQDLNLYRVPADAVDLLSAFTAILNQ